MLTSTASFLAPCSTSSSFNGHSKRATLNSDVGKLILLPGNVFNIKKINDIKILGRSSDKRLAYVPDQYKRLVDNGFGFISGDQSTFYPNIVHDVSASPKMTKILLNDCVQFPKCIEARAMDDKFKDLPVKQKKKSVLQ